MYVCMYICIYYIYMYIYVYIYIFISYIYIKRRIKYSRNPYIFLKTYYLYKDVF